MSNSNTDSLETKGRLNRLLAFSFATNGTSQPATSSFESTGKCLQSVTYSATGVYTVVLDSQWGRLISGTPSLQLDAGTADKDITLTSWDNDTKTLVLQVRNTSAGAAAAPPATGTANRVHFIGVFNAATTL